MIVKKSVKLEKGKLKLRFYFGLDYYQIRSI